MSSEYQKQITNIQELFSKFDSDATGKISLERIPDLLIALGRDEARAHKVKDAISGAVEGKEVSFEQVVQTLKAVESSSADAASASHQAPVAPPVERPEGEETTTPLSLMRRLEEYRKQCENNGDYAEARKARAKYEDIRSKEEDRQKRLVQQAQVHELAEVEIAQKQQFLEFSAAWDRYMADYESTAYMSLERLKEQHAQAFSIFQGELHANHAAPKSVKYSRELLEMRRKEHALAKLGKYEEAYQIKNNADNLEKWEVAKNQSQTSDSVRRQEERVRMQQQKALAALLKRIQRDRGEQIRHRQMDSKRLIQRNKNLKCDLIKKQHLELQRAEAAIKSILNQPEYAQKLLDENPVVVAKNAALGELPSLKGKWNKQLGALPNNYVPPGGARALTTGK